MEETKSTNNTATKLKRVARLSGEDPHMEFIGLMPHVNKESLIGCFNELKGRRAVGIDQMTKEEYGKDLERNIEDLISRMKEMSYHPSPVREVMIPKEQGQFRPLGISTLEDKIVQLMFSKILEAIYEPIFFDCSYGFRRGRSCHDAIKACRQHIFEKPCSVIIDVDLQIFFGTISHKKLVSILRMKIKDERFIRYIVRMLKSGVLSDGELKKTEEGTPQGSCCSPILSNIFAHYALDQWFNQSVKPNIQGVVGMFRYCDDFVICCEFIEEADRIQSSLKSRTQKYSLKMNMEKTKQVPFSRSKAQSGIKQGNFCFLGFTFYLRRSKSGFIVPKLKTSGKRMKSKLKRVNEWCRINRSKSKLLTLWKIFCSKLRGHVQYYGVSDNSRRVEAFLHQATRIFFKWINRRSQRRSKNWESFERFLKANPPPKALVRHRMY